MRLIDAEKLILHLNDYALTEAPDERESADERRISKAVYNAILNCIKAVEEQMTDGWIPATERLPEEDGTYLVTFNDGTRRTVGYGTCQRTVFGRPIGHGWYDLYAGSYYADRCVIAWMPLPECYKEEIENG